MPISLFFPVYHMMRTAYLLYFMCSCLIVLAITKLKMNYVGSLTCLYIMFGLLFAICIYLSVITSPYYRATVLLGMVSVIPFLILDKSWRVNLFVCSFIFIHTLLAYRLKGPSIAFEDLVNSMIFFVLGVFVGANVRATKVRNFTLQKQTICLAEADFLTGLFNRRKMYDSIIESENGSRPIIGVILFDIDHFKGFNDNYGHLAGDECLRKIGQLLMPFGESYNAPFFRFGGEEFIGFMYDTRFSIDMVAENLRQSVSNLNIPYPDNEIGHVTISVGYCSPDIFPDTSIQKLITAADQALYEAKATGRNCAICYTDKMSNSKACLSQKITFKNH